MPRKLAIAGLVVIALVVAARLIIDPIATYETRQGLAKVQGAHGDFERVHVSVVPPEYFITRLKLTQGPAGARHEPIFYAEEIHVGVDWRRLLHRELGVGVRILRPKITFVAEKKEAPETAHAALDISKQLKDLFPFEIERVEILEGEVLYRDEAAPERGVVWIHRLALAAENLSNRTRPKGARPATVSAKGVVGDTGRMDLFVSADPLASPLAFAGRFKVVDLEMSELYGLIEPQTKLQIPAGTLNVFAEFTAKGGHIKGGIKPVLKNIEVRPGQGGTWNAVKAWAANLGVKLASDRVPDRNAVATTIPITGPMADPDVQLWPAVLGVIRNAFVEGVASGFSNLPPPSASHPEGKLEQTKKALDKDSDAPKAQPPKAQGEAK
jgi:hypothetical protein